MERKQTQTEGRHTWTEWAITVRRNTPRRFKAIYLSMNEASGCAVHLHAHDWSPLYHQKPKRKADTVAPIIANQLNREMEHPYRWKNDDFKNARSDVYLKQARYRKNTSAEGKAMKYQTKEDWEEETKTEYSRNRVTTIWRKQLCRYRNTS